MPETTESDTVSDKQEHVCLICGQPVRPQFIVHWSCYIEDRARERAHEDEREQALRPS